MRTRRTLSILATIACTLAGTSLSASAQSSAGSAPATVNVYLDCGFCDFDHLRTEIAYVNWVRDRAVADVHLLATSQGTGGGGSELTFTFIGLRDFSRLVDTLKTVVSVDATADNRRVAYTRTIKVGLVPYLTRTALVDRISVSVAAPTTASATATPQHDRWHGWVFRLSASAFTNGEKSYQSFNSFYDGSANRITERWKTSIGGNYSYDDQKSTVENGNEAGDADTTYVTIKRNWRSYGSQFRGLTDHWSLGLTGNLGSNTYQNQSRYASAKAAIEYNLFPYRESTRRQLRAQYGIGAAHYAYEDTTIYLKTSETVPVHFAAVALSARQPWGNVSANLTRNQMLLKPSFRSTVIYGNADIRIMKGLSLFFSGEYNWIHDQLYLRKGSATTTSVLLRQQALATSFSYYGNIGLSYTFGSIFNNVVFPRFGGNSSF